MARPQEFDTDEAVEQALAVFRRKGYAQSSLADLLAATGLSKSSLYATFGSKHALFLRAFDQYRAQRRRLAVIDLRATPEGPGLEAYCRRILRQVFEQPPCLLLRQSIESQDEDPEVRERVHADFAELVVAFRQTIARGQADGSIGSIQPADQLAQSLAVSVIGMMALGGTGLPPQTGDTALAALMDLLQIRREQGEIADEGQAGKAAGVL